MTEDTFKDLCLCGKTTKVQFKEAFTSQKEIAKEMIAFANSKGGVILFGVEDKSGKLVGLSYDEIQVISRELGNAANGKCAQQSILIQKLYVWMKSISLYVYRGRQKQTLQKPQRRDMGETRS